MKQYKKMRFEHYEEYNSPYKSDKYESLIESEDLYRQFMRRWATFMTNHHVYSALGWNIVVELARPRRR